MLTRPITRIRDAQEGPAGKWGTVIYLDCPPDKRMECERQFTAANLRVVWAESGAMAAAELQRRDLPVLVGFSRGAAALQAIREIRAVRPEALIFAAVDSERPDLATEAVLAGVADILPTDVDGARLVASIEREAGYAAQTVSEARVTGTQDIYSLSASMREVCGAVARAAATRAGVLVVGEHGTGRQTIARAIHAADKARAGRFVVVDCSTIEPDQLGHVLFGVASRDDEDSPAVGLERLSRNSRLGEALGGTLYLQHIADAPTRTQRRLARLLRDREAMVVEDGAAVTFDLRCVTAADSTLEAAVRDGRLEAALYRRLSAIRIDVPSLRSRREDIPALANYFLRRSCASLGVPCKMFSRSALAVLAALPWPGNAAELETLLTTIVRGLGTRGLGVEQLLAHVRLDAGSIAVTQSGTLRQARARFEHEYIAATLRQHHGRITQAAKALGMQRTNLYRKMRALRVAQPRTR